MAYRSGAVPRAPGREKRHKYSLNEQPQGHWLASLHLGPIGAPSCKETRGLQLSGGWASTWQGKAERGGGAGVSLLKMCRAGGGENGRVSQLLGSEKKNFFWSSFVFFSFLSFQKQARSSRQPELFHVLFLTQATAAVLS